MNWKWSQGVMLVMVLICSLSQAQEGAEFTPLLHDNSLKGWVEMGETEVYSVSDGVLSAENPASVPNWLRSEKEYENFNLRLEYRMPGWCEAGILIHAPLYGRASKAGMKLHLRHNDLDEGSRSVGAIYDVLAPMARVPRAEKEWNQMEITSDWPWLRVRLNGTLIQDVNREEHPELRYRLRQGFIGLQDLNCRIDYRNIEIRELPSKEKWRELFDGTSLQGWRVLGDARWSVEEDRIISHGGDGYLITEEAFSRFEFQVYVRTSSHANGGVFYRWVNRQERGYEAQIYNVLDSTNPTGSIYQVVPAQDPPSRDGQWFLLKIVSDGPYSAIWVDGQKVAETCGLAKPDHGNIALQMHSRGQIEFMRPRIKFLVD